MHSKFAEVFAVAMLSVVRGEMARCAEAQPRTTRKEFLENFQEEDHEVVSLVLQQELKQEDSPYDTLKGPGGGFGFKGAAKADKTKHIIIREELLAKITAKAEEILKPGMARGFNPPTMAALLGMLNAEGISEVTAHLSALAANGKLENRKGVGYCKPGKPPPTAAIPAN